MLNGKDRKMTPNYISLSLETHLFFARIMREHALFLAAGFPCCEDNWIQKADWFRQQFEDLLREVIKISDGRIHKPVITSNELVTEFTIPAENRTQQLSGIPIDSELSALELKLCPQNTRENNRAILPMIHQFNRHAVSLLNGLISFKESILKEVSRGNLFNANYPLLIQHILREARLYRATLEELMQNRPLSYQNLWETEQFWNQIMMEHALFIRGLLDPSETELVCTADGFAADYKQLLDIASQQDCKATEAMTEKSLEKTLEYRQFKTAGASGILDRSIASIILPLLADHVLREANHYIRLLECSQNS